MWWMKSSSARWENTRSSENKLTIKKPSWIRLKMPHHKAENSISLSLKHGFKCRTFTLPAVEFLSPLDICDLRTHGRSIIQSSFWHWGKDEAGWQTSLGYGTQLLLFEQFFFCTFRLFTSSEDTEDQVQCSLQSSSSHPRIIKRQTCQSFILQSQFAQIQPPNLLYVYRNILVCVRMRLLFNDSTIHHILLLYFAWLPPLLLQ